MNRPIRPRRSERGTRGPAGRGKKGSRYDSQPWIATGSTNAATRRRKVSRRAGAATSARSNTLSSAATAGGDGMQWAGTVRSARACRRRRRLIVAGALSAIPIAVAGTRPRAANPARLSEEPRPPRRAPRTEDGDLASEASHFTARWLPKDSEAMTSGTLRVDSRRRHVVEGVHRASEGRTEEPAGGAGERDRRGGQGRAVAIPPLIPRPGPRPRELPNNTSPPPPVRLHPSTPAPAPTDAAR